MAYGRDKKHTIFNWGNCLTRSSMDTTDIELQLILFYLKFAKFVIN